MPELVTIKLVEAIGPGKFRKEQDILEMKPDPELWKKSINVPTKLYRKISRPVLVEVRGRCMEPTIFHGNFAVVDCDNKTLQSGGIFVFEFPKNHYNKLSGLQTKRVGEITDQYVMLRTDNPRHPDYIVFYDALKVMGKVRAVARPTDDPEMCEWTEIV